MANTEESWKPSHTDVLTRLLKNLDKLGITAIDHLTEVRIVFGQDKEGRLDLVTIGRKRTRKGKQGNIVTLFEIKTEASRLFRVVADGVQQLTLYELALNNPDLYITEQEKVKKLSNTLAYKNYLVIQQALLDEWEDLSEHEWEKFSEILAFFNVGIITYDNKWKFSIDKNISEAQEEDTEWLTKRVVKAKINKKQNTRILPH